jgi:predicted nucleic acid-binding protein
MADMRHHLVTRAIIDCAVALHRQRKISLGDALIAGTALEHNLTLITRNTRDSQWISQLALINPFEQSR